MADESGLKHADITREIIGAAMEVHSQLGNGFQEVIYQRSLEIEFKDRGIEFLREQEMPLFIKTMKSEHVGRMSLSITGLS